MTITGCPCGFLGLEAAVLTSQQRVHGHRNICAIGFLISTASLKQMIVKLHPVKDFQRKSRVTENVLPKEKKFREMCAFFTRDYPSAHVISIDT